MVDSVVNLFLRIFTSTEDLVSVDTQWAGIFGKNSQKSAPTDFAR